MPNNPNTPTVTLGGAVASENLLGVNLEMVAFVTEALVSNRIRNPKFGGFADPQTGVAAEWQPRGNNWNGIARVEGGMFLSAPQCQSLQSYTGHIDAGILQTGVPVRAREILEFKMWARCRHHPVEMEVLLRPLSAGDPAYVSAPIRVDTTYWKCYTARFPIETTDDQAVLIIYMKEIGIVHIDQVSLEPEGSCGTNPDTSRAIAELNPPLIRFPGGCMSTTYQWRYGVGPRHLRPTLPDTVFKWRAEYDYGTDEYLEQCRALGIAPHITVNLGDTPEEAAAWAAYCWNWYVSRGIKPPQAYFQMGNESYGVWEISHMTADMYVEVLKAFVPGVRAAYPGARIVATAMEVSNPLPGAEPTPLRKALLDGAQGFFDVLAIHCYKGQWFADPAAQCQNAADSVEKVSRELDQLADDCRQAGWSPRLAITEWNYWLKAAHWDGQMFHEPDDATHAIFFSGVVHALLRRADVVEFSSYYHLLIAMGLIDKTPDGAHANAIGNLYRLYRTALPGTVLPLEFIKNPSLDSIAIRHREGTSVFVFNRSISETVPLELPSSFGRPTDSRTFAAPDYRSPMNEIEKLAPCPALALPPLSLTRLDFHLPSS